MKPVRNSSGRKPSPEKGRKPGGKRKGVVVKNSSEYPTAEKAIMSLDNLWRYEDQQRILTAGSCQSDEVQDEEAGDNSTEKSQETSSEECAHSDDEESRHKETAQGGSTEEGAQPMGDDEERHKDEYHKYTSHKQGVLKTLAALMLSLIFIALFSIGGIYSVQHHDLALLETLGKHIDKPMLLLLVFVFGTFSGRTWL